MIEANQREIDAKNAQFWTELCGSEFARSLGIRENTPETLARFDAAYLDFYPYLAPYVTNENLTGKRVLEIGLGYGTLGQFIASRGCTYVGLDISPGPPAMMRERLSRTRPGGDWSVYQGSALAMPFADGAFDFVYSIGCLHHTGDLPAALAEVHRVLAPGGKAIVMLYHRWAFPRLYQIFRISIRSALFGSSRSVEETIRAHYDHDSSGVAAPHTNFSSRRDIRRLFRAFSRVRTDVQNFEGYSLRVLPRLRIPRKWFLGNVARISGTDLYVVATK